MPCYPYECRNCNHDFECQQSMTDEPITLCPQCGKKEVRRIIKGAGIVFKGAGFYVNDKNIEKKSEKEAICNKPQCCKKENNTKS